MDIKKPVQGVSAFGKAAEGQAVAGSLPTLALEARNLANKIAGLRSKRSHGPGYEFHDHRPYEQGDEPRRIDYRTSARSQHDENSGLLVRRQEHEVTQIVYLWRDGTASMDYKASPDLFSGAEAPRFTKKQTAEILLLAMAYLAANSDEHYGLIGSDLRLRGNDHGVMQIAQELTHEKTHALPKDLPRPPAHRGRPLSASSHVVIFSDFLCPAQEIEDMVKKFQGVRAHVHLVQILDPSEVDFRFRGHVRFKDMESDFSYTAKKAQMLRDQLAAVLQERTDMLAGIARRNPGWSFSRFVTNRPLTEALLPVYGLAPTQAAAPVKAAAPAPVR